MLNLLEFIPFFFLLTLVFLGLFIWLIILQIKYNELSQNNERLERYIKNELSSYDTLFDSLEAEIERRCSAISQQQNVASTANQQKAEQNKAQSAKSEKVQSQSARFEQTQAQYTKSKESEPIKSEQVQPQSAQPEQTARTEFKENVVKNEKEAESKTETNVYTENLFEKNKDESANRVKENIEEPSKAKENLSNTEECYSKAEERFSKSTFESTYSKESVETTKAKKLHENISNNEEPFSQKDEPTKEPISFVQLFSWIGGFILLLGVIFWIKYALENDLISATMRIAMGTLTGIALWFTGALMRKPNVKTTSDTLCACGLCILYSVWFSAYYFYQMTTTTQTFAILSMIALASFGTAVWKNAQYIGVLAQIIGFLTPALFHSEEPQVWFLLSYISIINIAAVAAAFKRNWTNQLYSGLAFTFLSFLSIVNTKSMLELTIFPSVFVIFYTFIASHKDQKWLLRMAFAFSMITLIILGVRQFDFKLSALPYLAFYSAFFAIGYGLLAAKKKDNELIICSLIFTFLSFILIALAKSFTTLFIFVIVLSIFFGLLCSLLQKQYLQIASMFLSGLGFIALYSCQSGSLLDVAHLPYLAGFSVFFVIFFCIIAYLQKNPVLFLNSMLLASVCFALLVPYENKTYLISLSTIYTLLFGIFSYIFDKQNLMITSIVFTSFCLTMTSFIGAKEYNFILSFAIAYVIFYLFFAIKQKNGVVFSVNAFSLFIPLIVLTSISLFNKNATNLLWWIGGWNLLLMLSIFLCKKEFNDSQEAWKTISLCNIVTGLLFIIIFRLTSELYDYTGRAAFGLVLLYTFFTERIIRWSPLEEGIQKTRITSLVCAPIILLTLAIMFQFHKEVMTICLALEGLALIVLWHFLPINLLQYSGYTVLLVLTTPRLLFNPFIEDYYKQTALILNWYLYTYLICASAMLGSAYCWGKELSQTCKTSLNVIGGILLFALVNIEIANYFGEGKELNFKFTGELAEAATYTIAWTIFGALCMILARKNNKGLLYSGIGLIGLSVFKLFVSDIWSLSSGLRIVVLIAVAIIMLAISFIYQQLKRTKTTNEIN